MRCASLWIPRPPVISGGGTISKLNLNGIFLFLDIGARNHTISIKQTNRKEHWTQIANAEMYFFLFFPFSFFTGFFKAYPVVICI